MAKLTIIHDKRVYKDEFLALPAELIHQMCTNQITIHVSSIQQTRQFERLERQLIQWVSENCSGLYKFQTNSVNFTIHFQNENDMVAFKLRWEGDVPD